MNVAGLWLTWKGRTGSAVDSLARRCLAFRQPTVGEAMGQYQVSEDVVLQLWEQYSGRSMTAEELARAQGHPLVTRLRTFSKVALMRAAFSARRRGQDLDWALWRDWTLRQGDRREREEAARDRTARAKAMQAEAERTDRVFNAKPRRPNRYSTESGRASAPAPGYSGGTLPHAHGKPSRHY